MNYDYSPRRADHDVALGIEDVRFGRRFPIGSETGTFSAERERVGFERGCPAALNIHTGQIDGGAIYGSDPVFLANTVRVPGSCNLRVASTPAGEFPPVTTRADDQGRFFFLAGDIRISEHSFLFSQHTVRHPYLRAAFLPACPTHSLRGPLLHVTLAGRVFVFSRFTLLFSRLTLL